MALGFGGAIDSLIVAIQADVGDFEKGIRQATQGVQKFDHQVSRQLTGTTTSVNRLATAFSGIGRSLVAGAGIGSLGLVFSKASKDAAAFETQMAEISTLLSDTSGVDTLTRALEDASKAFGSDIGRQAGALYSIVSAGATDAAKATEILTQANRLAIGGVTDVATAADGLTSILNAYGAAAGTAANVSDALFVAVRAGKTTVGELAQGIGVVAPLAAQAGASLEEMLSAVAALTKGGVSTNTAMTGLRAILAGVVKPSQEAADEAERLGINFSAAALKSKGFAAFMDEVREKSQGSTKSLAQLFGGVEAVVPALALAGNAAADFALNMDGMRNRAGEAERAFEKLNKTTGQAFAQLRENINAALRDSGSAINKALAPAIRALATHFDDVVLAITSTTKALIVGASAWGVYRAAVAAVALRNVIAGFVALTAQLRLSTVALLAAGNAGRALWAAIGGPIGLAVTALGTLGLAFFAAGKKAREAAEESRRAAEDFSNSLQAMDMAFLKTELRKAEREFQRFGIEVRNAQTALDELRLQQRQGPAINLTRTALEIEEAEKALARLGRERTAARLRLLEVVDEIGERLKDQQAVTVPDLDPGNNIPAAADAFTTLREQIDATFVRLDFFQRKLAALPATQLPGTEGIGGGFAAEIVGGQVFTEVRRLEDALGRVRDQIEAAGGAHRANVELLEIELRIVERLAGLTPQLDLTPIGFVGKDVKQAAAATRDLAAELGAVTAGARGLVQVADSMGKLGDATRRALDGVLGLVDAFSELSRARKLAAEAERLSVPGKDFDAAGAAAASAGAAVAKISGIIAAVGGFVSILSGLITNTSRAEQERLAAIRENNKTLEKLRQTLEGFTVTAAGLSGAIPSIEPIIEAVREALEKARGIAFGTERGRFGESAVEFLNREMLRLGASLGQLETYAESLGITLRDSAGRLIPDALDQLQEALRLAAVAAATFSNSLTDQRRLLDARVAIFDEPLEGPRAIQREIAFIAQQIGPAFAGLFQGIDASTAEGRAAAEQLIRDMFNKIQQGVFGLDPAQLGNFGTVEEFLDALLGVDSALDDFASTIDSTTSALRNVPEGFRVALARFNAETPRFDTATGAVSITDIGRGPGRFTTQDTYYISIDAGNRPIAVVFDEVTEEARRRKLSRSGTTAQPFDMP